MKLRGGEYSTGTTGNFQSELTGHRLTREKSLECAAIEAESGGHKVDSRSHYLTRENDLEEHGREFAR